MATDVDAPSEVSWQTAFFLLLGIAFVAMSQPCGQFLGMHSKHRVWLRTSPLLCLADTLVIIAQFHYYSVKGDTPRNAMRRILQTRFVGAAPALERADQVEPTTLDPPELDIAEASLHGADYPNFREDTVPLHIFPMDGETLSSIEQKLQLRFILGVFPLYPAIKLYTLIGIPCTQAFAAMYITSIFSVEILLWCAKPYKQVQHLLPLDHDIFTFNPLIIASHLESTIINRFRFGVNILASIILPVYTYVFIDTWKATSTVVYPIFAAVFTFAESTDIAKVGTSKTWLSCFCHWLMIIHSTSLAIYGTLQTYLEISIWLLFIYLILHIAFVFTNSPHYKNTQYSTLPARQLILIMFFFIFCLTTELLTNKSRDTLWSDSMGVFIGAAVFILLLPLQLRTYHKNKYVLFAAHDLFGFLLCYAYIYDPTGTINPGWEANWV